MAIRCSFPFHARLLRRDFLHATLALCRLHCAHRVEDVLAGHVVLALPARRRRPRAVALDQLLFPNTGVRLNVVDILGVVCKQLVLILQQPYELVRGRPFLEIWHDVASQLVEDARVLVEVVDVEHLLWLIVAHRSQARVEACVLGAKVRDAQAGRDAGASDDQDVLALLQQPGRVIDRLVLVETRALVQLTVDGEAKQLVEALIRGVVEEPRDLDVERCAQLARRHLL